MKDITSQCYVLTDAQVTDAAMLFIKALIFTWVSIEMARWAFAIYRDRRDLEAMNEIKKIEKEAS